MNLPSAGREIYYLKKNNVEYLYDPILEIGAMKTKEKIRLLGKSEREVLKREIENPQKSSAITVRRRIKGVYGYTALGPGDIIFGKLIQAIKEKKPAETLFEMLTPS